MRLLQPKAALRPNEERLRHPKEKTCSLTTKSTNTKKALPYEKNRKAAATELYNLAKAYEKVTYETIYRKCYYSSRQSCWKYIGKAHDYSY